MKKLTWEDVLGNEYWARCVLERIKQAEKDGKVCLNPITCNECGVSMMDCAYEYMKIKKHYDKMVHWFKDFNNAEISINFNTCKESDKKRLGEEFIELQQKCVIVYNEERKEDD